MYSAQVVFFFTTNLFPYLDPVRLMAMDSNMTLIHTLLFGVDKHFTVVLYTHLRAICRICISITAHEMTFLLLLLLFLSMIIFDSRIILLWKLYFPHVVWIGNSFVRVQNLSAFISVIMRGFHCWTGPEFFCKSSLFQLRATRD